ncbi:MAG: hypothetical protein GX137_04075 [Thermoplasmatales archaeon]|nr:hypothetical protein [Thermoplasmatales archaeon]
MFRFNDADVYWALHVLSDGKRMGRKRLAEALGIGEGSVRRIVDTLRDWEMISVHQTGITITRSGLGFLAELPVKVLDISLGDSVVGDCQQSILVYGVGSKIENGMQQRDVGIRVGALGCTTVVMRDEVLMIPPDWNLDEERPDIAEKIRKTDMGPNDAIIVGSAQDSHTAVNAALMAAFQLF